MQIDPDDIWLDNLAEAIPMEFSTSYELLLQCYLTGQMTERQWQEHLKDEHFAAWIKKRRERAANEIAKHE